jgi:HSP20 family molecular chaperone IbpA
MKNELIKKIVNKPFVLGCATLMLGALIGAAAEKYTGRTSPTAQGEPSKRQAYGLTGPATNLPSTGGFASGAGEPWDPFREMRSLQAEMDQLMQQSIQRFHMDPQMDMFKDDAGYSSSLDVRDLKDHFEVRAYLPDAKTADAQVKLQGNRLQVDVTGNQSDQPQSGGGTATATAWGHYSQIVQLDGAVQADKMKVERKDHELLITIPKA